MLSDESTGNVKSTSVIRTSGHQVDVSCPNQREQPPLRCDLRMAATHAHAHTHTPSRLRRLPALTVMKTPHRTKQHCQDEGKTLKFPARPPDSHGSVGGNLVVSRQLPRAAPSVLPTPSPSPLLVLSLLSLLLRRRLATAVPGHQFRGHCRPFSPLAQSALEAREADAHHHLALHGPHARPAVEARLVPAHQARRRNLAHASGVAVGAGAVEGGASGAEAGASVQAGDAHAGVQGRLASLAGELRAAQAAGREAGTHSDARAVVEALEAQARVQGQVAVAAGVARAALAVVAVDPVPAYAPCSRDRIKTQDRLELRTRLRHCSTLSSFKAKLKTFLFLQFFHPN